tara:strand:+ start:158 stop:1204 length:1047 start_codon:yes stop_codon:yes gene_type:complete
MQLNINLNNENKKENSKMTSTNLELETLFTLQKGLTEQLQFIDKRIEEIANKTERKIYRCELFDLTFTDEEKYNKHISSKRYKVKTGLKPIRCKLCNNVFYGDKDLGEHYKNGKCEKSRTYNGIVFKNMMNKSKYMKENKEESVMGKGVAEKDEPINKKKKVKLIIKPKPSTPLILVNKNPKPVTTNYKKDKTNKVELFNKDKKVKLTKEEKEERGKYKLKPLPDKKEHITGAWYMSLYEAHKSQPFTDGEGFYTKKTSETGFKFDRCSSFRKVIIDTAKDIQKNEYDKKDTDPEQLYLKSLEYNILYWSDGSKAGSISNEGDNYYEITWSQYNENGEEIPDTEVKVV